MRNTILGFNQKELLTYNVSMNEVLLLDYIYHAVASPTMKHKIQNNQSYVWISHSKILSDLPILDISADRLKRVLKHLVEIELISVIKVNNDNGRGSCSYYAITSKCEQLKYSDDQVLKTTLDNERPSVKNNTSYNQLDSNNINTKVFNKLNTTTEQTFLGSAKQKKQPKQNLYTKCSNTINEFTDDIVTRELLFKFLNMLMDMYKEAGEPLYSNVFKGKLNMLKSFPSSQWNRIIQQTLDMGWKGFYALKQDNNNFSQSASVRSERETEEDVRKREEFLARKKANGERTQF